MDQVEFMLDHFVETEGDPEVIKFSGGEPTIHPDLMEMIQAAKDRASAPGHNQHQRSADRPGRQVPGRAGQAEPSDLTPIRRSAPGDLCDHPGRGPSGIKTKGPRPVGRGGHGRRAGGRH